MTPRNDNNETPTEPIETFTDGVECAICRVETGQSLTYRVFDVEGMRAHLRNGHAASFTLALHFPDPSEEKPASFDYGD